MSSLLQFCLGLYVAGVTCDVVAAWLLERDPRVN
jgi:hypothetical protein